MADMTASLQTNGYYTFPSGRTISNYVWTKYVQINGAVATVTQTPVDTDPAQTPGWRGI